MDDSTSVISFTDTNQMRDYLTGYYNLLGEYYTANKLKINPEKSKFIINSKPKFTVILKNFYFWADGFKILGTFIKSDLKMDLQINKLCSTLHNRIFQLRKITKFTHFKTRICFLRSYVIGKLIYAIPLYMTCTMPNINTIHKVIMAAARASIGHYCYKKSTKYILLKCDFMDANNLILYSTLCFYYNMNKTGKPGAILDLFHPQNKRSKSNKYRPRYLPTAMSIDNGCLYKGARIFDSLPDNCKLYTKEKFRKFLKGYLAEREVWDTHD